MTPAPVPSPRPALTRRPATRTPGTSSVSTAGATRRRRPLFLSLLGACVLMLVIGVTWKQQRERPLPESEVRQKVTKMALEGAWLGGLFIQADRLEPRTGDLLGFRATTDALLLSAERARLVLDRDTSAISFELAGVLLVVAERDRADQDGHMAAFDHYTLGPFPLKIKVTADPSLELPARDRSEALRQLTEVPLDLPKR